ncbi:asparagine synthase (glutamine-hydrolyzing) [Bacillus sp. FJAT-47783]|uniref:asparagine synthase (glutamine-hydrolyzing) n=1 Tax=Bacillus sp. FJAT-47783 TaxID=2922712 RepID=UPI001FABF7E7|nr:asparagine synthase (glutamine-hydrolyzing) [Bacillus sp. FJAT-47783]
MCGFIGVVRKEPQWQTEQERQHFSMMNNIIEHRGPDDEGYYEDEFVRFGFRRLSIIDLENGHQPLSYENERYWIIFNGEIYNFVELREELQEKGLTFTTGSDTEVILGAYQAYGYEAASKLRGMFAFLIWDKEEKTIYGARDPFGIKPLYFYEEDERYFFASEKKSISLARHQEVIDHESLQHYLTFQYVPEPKTMSSSIHKVLPGHYFILKHGEDISFHRYFHARFQPIQQEEQALIQEIQDVLRDSVNVHMRSDVPVGSFLSGGIDSSFIAALAREINPNIKTFSVGFEREGFSEVDVAKETADVLNVENISYIISPEEYMQELPKIIWHLDDPLADPAAIPLYFVAREARKHVTVVLSGEGADELFGGYNIYREPLSLSVFQSIPSSMKKALKWMAHMMPDGMKGKSFIERGCTPLEERYVGNAKMFEHEEKARLFRLFDESKKYQELTKPFYEEARDYDDISTMQYIDIHTWLRGDILLKADKMTMANSLELRVPFLDKRVFEVASKIPSPYKVADQTTKTILRKAAKGIVPHHVLDRKKLGFPVPIRHWLKNEMHDWAKEIIRESETDHLINKSYLLGLLDEHCQNKRDHSRKIWTVLVFMIWHQIFMEEKYSFNASQKAEKQLELIK